jgi:glycosyltransferase involved in cell wall biosynthesis
MTMTAQTRFRAAERVIDGTPRVGRLKILVSAYACRPGAGSEMGMAWACAQALSSRHEVWVITRQIHRPYIERELKRNPNPNLHFLFFELPDWTRTFKREGKPTLVYYYLWQLFAPSFVRREAGHIAFDVAHHVTFAKYWAPSLLAFLKIPYVWGPVGGGESAPASFWKDFGLRGLVYETMRSAMRWFFDHDPVVRLTARRSAVALGTTEETSARLRAIGARDVRTCHAIALAEGDLANLNDAPRRDGAGCRFISIGRLLHWKGFHLGVEAFARADIDGGAFWIVGDGPERRRIQALAERLDIAEKVRFFGTLPQDETHARLGEVDVLVHPSLHESGGMVGLEAMAAGKPVICLDLGGPALQVTDDVGIRVPAAHRDTAIDGLAAAMKRLAGDRALCEAMGDAGRRRVSSREYRWDRKLEIYEGIYREVAARAESRT